MTLVCVACNAPLVECHQFTKKARRTPNPPGSSGSAGAASDHFEFSPQDLNVQWDEYDGEVYVSSCGHLYHKRCLFELFPPSPSVTGPVLGVTLNSGIDCSILNPAVGTCTSCGSTLVQNNCIRVYLDPIGYPRPSFVKYTKFNKILRDRIVKLSDAVRKREKLLDTIESDRACIHRLQMKSLHLESRGGEEGSGSGSGYDDNESVLEFFLDHTSSGKTKSKHGGGSGRKSCNEFSTSDSDDEKQVDGNSNSKARISSVCVDNFGLLPPDECVYQRRSNSDGCHHRNGHMTKTQLQQKYSAMDDWDRDDSPLALTPACTAYTDDSVLSLLSLTNSELDDDDENYANDDNEEDRPRFFTEVSFDAGDPTPYASASVPIPKTTEYINILSESSSSSSVGKIKSESQNILLPPPRDFSDFDLLNKILTE